MKSYWFRVGSISSVSGVLLPTEEEIDAGEDPRGCRQIGAMCLQAKERPGSPAHTGSWERAVGSILPQAPEGTHPDSASACILDFGPLEPWKNKFLLFKVIQSV